MTPTPTPHNSSAHQNGVIFVQPRNTHGQRSPPLQEKILAKKPTAKKVGYDRGKETLNEDPKAKPIQQINEIIEKTHKPLFKLSAFFPFDLWPDSISIDIEKVSIVIRVFFRSDFIHTIPIKDIKDVTVETNIFFGTLKIFSVNPIEQNPLKVSFLKRGEAMRARRIIKGLLIATKEGVDFTKVDPDEITDKVDTLGSATAD